MLRFAPPSPLPLQNSQRAHSDPKSEPPKEPSPSFGGCTGSERAGHPLRDAMPDFEMTPKGILVK